MYRVTIALSVYNVVNYIRFSLDSVLAQTFRSFELLCIDDASTDGTWEILKQYALKDRRIRLIRQEENRGLSVSRNLAIKEARGEYLIMLDGDDLFAPDMVEKAYYMAKETDADMVMWDYVSFLNEDEIKSKCSRPSSLRSIDINDKNQLLRRPAFTPSRLLKVSTIRALRIQYPVGLTKQDIPVHWKLVTSLDKIAIVPEYFLYYRVQPNSTSARRDSSMFSLAYVMDIVGDQLRTDGFYDKYRNEYLRSRLSLLYGMYDAVLPSLKKEAKGIVMDRLGKDERSYIDNPTSELSPRVRCFYGMIGGKAWCLIKFKIFNIIRSIYRLFKNPQ